MEKNIEQKFAVPHFRALESACRRYEERGVFRQIDAYYSSQEGRLKTRAIDNVRFELLFYRREDVRKGRLSRYSRMPLSQEDYKELSKILSRTNGLIGIVRKIRRVYYDQNVRINLDRVQGLGVFIELEAEVRNGYGRAESRRNFLRVKKNLGLRDQDSQALSYIDLLADHKSGQGNE